MRGWGRLLLGGAALAGIGAWVRRQPVGTRSLLVGAHQFAIHPVCVAVGWRTLYGAWPRSWKLWLCIVTHDWGYFGRTTLDGEDGVLHPDFGGRLAGYLCSCNVPAPARRVAYNIWWRFSAGHSRTFAHLAGIQPSLLMRPDKLATALCPRPLLALLYWLSGEWKEYHWRWMDAGTYPGSGDDGAWAFAGHIQANFARFTDPAAHVGGLHSGE